MPQNLSARELKLQGIAPPEMVSIDVRKWRALKRQMVRMVIGWRHTDREVDRILEACRHADGCLAPTDPTRPCLPECPDRENFLSALVIKRNAEQFSMLQQGLPSRVSGEDYRPPPREYFDAIVSELETLREGTDVLADLVAAMEKGAAGSWPEEDRAQPMEKPLTRLMPPQPEPEDEDDEEPSGGDDGGEPAFNLHLEDE
jgi:hypothetical protein